MDVRYEKIDNGRVLVTVISNELLKEVEGWVLLTDGKTLTKEYSVNSDERIVINDLAGNEIIVKIEVKGINEPEEALKEDDKDNTNTSSILTSGKSDTTTTTIQLPNTGNKIILGGLIIVLSIVSGIIYVRMSKMDK